MAGNRVNIEGLGPLLQRLEALPREIAGKNGGPVRRALGRAARLVRDEVRANAPKRTGRLEANVIAARVRDDRPPGVAERFVVSVRGRRARYGDTRENRRAGRVGKTYQRDGEAFYWKFLEFGTAKMPARPFIQPSFAARAQDALDEFTRALGADLDKIVRKLNSQG